MIWSGPFIKKIQDWISGASKRYTVAPRLTVPSNGNFLQLKIRASILYTSALLRFGETDINASERGKNNVPLLSHLQVHYP